MLPSRFVASVVLLAAALCATPQFPQGNDCPPEGLEVIMVDVGQGDGLVIKAPDGTVHVVDAGPEGSGTPMITAINSLSPTGYGASFLSHYHTDHMGDLDDVLNAFPFTFSYDRGFFRTPTNSIYNDYVSAAGSRRRQVALGQTIQLGGGATARVIAVNGVVVGGTTIPVSGRTQEENARSMVLRVEYGDFSMWLGGDLTGGGNGTPDVESAASLACGDVDVYHVNHHGSNTSSQANLVARLDPELCLVSAGSNNPYGHPTNNTINRINQAAAVRMLLSTTQGTGSIGFGVTGNTHLVTDGVRYRVTASNGDFLDFYTDEHAAALQGTGLRVSEFHRDPAQVGDTAGEFVELANVDARPIVLDGARLSDNGSSITFRTTVIVPADRPVVVARDGDPSRNGGLPLAVTMPFSSLALSNSSDSIQVRRGSTVVDFVPYSSSWPGAGGRSAERVDMLGSASTSSNYQNGAAVFGSGDRGSPGRVNDADASSLPVDFDAYNSGESLFFYCSSRGENGYLGLVGLAWNNTPTFPLLGVQIPLALDPLLTESLTFPQMVATIPGSGYRCVKLDLPSPNPFQGTQVWGAYVVLDLASEQIRAVTTALPITL